MVPSSACAGFPVEVLRKAPGAEPGWYGPGEGKRSGLQSNSGSPRVLAFLSSQQRHTGHLVPFKREENEPRVGNNLRQAIRLFQSQLFYSQPLLS